MEYIRDRVLRGEFLSGAWCNLASPLTVEICASLGYDWILVDQEHGPGDNLTLLHQAHAASRFPACVIVRIPWVDRILTKKALDMGLGGVMAPYVQTAEQAEEFVRYAKYTPDGERGIAASPRCSTYGPGFKDYFPNANRNLLTIAQIETARSVDNAEAIAAVPGIDVLFVGPLDLSISTKMPGMFEDPAFVDKLGQVVKAAARHGKATGILLSNVAHIPLLKELGYTFIACGSDGAAVCNGMQSTLAALRA